MRDRIIIGLGIILILMSIFSAYQVFLWMKVLFFRSQSFWYVSIILSILIGLSARYLLPKKLSSLDRLRAGFILWVFVLPLSMNGIYWFNSCFASEQSSERLPFESYVIYEQRPADVIVLAFDLQVHYKGKLHAFHSEDNTILAYKGKEVFMDIGHGRLGMDYWIKPEPVEKN